MRLRSHQDKWYIDHHQFNIVRDIQYINGERQERRKIINPHSSPSLEGIINYLSLSQFICKRDDSG